MSVIRSQLVRFISEVWLWVNDSVGYFYQYFSVYFHYHHLCVDCFRVETDKAVISHVFRLLTMSQCIHTQRHQMLTHSIDIIALLFLSFQMVKFFSRSFVSNLESVSVFATTCANSSRSQTELWIHIPLCCW